MSLRNTILGIVTAALLGCAGGVAHAADAKCGATTGKAATGEPIVIGGIVSVTGPDNFSSSGLAAAAYFKCLNANGGVNGRPIKYQMEDDGPDRDLGEEKRALGPRRVRKRRHRSSSAAIYSAEIQNVLPAGVRADRRRGRRM